MKVLRGRHIVGAGFLLALAILVSVNAVSYQGTSNFQRNAGWVEHTYQVLHELDHLRSGVEDFYENGATSQSNRLDGQGSQKQMEQSWQRLRRLTRDNAQQQLRLSSLEPVLNQFVTLMSRPGLSDRATTRAASLLNEIRRRVDDLEAEERALLNLRSQNVRDAAQRASRAWIAGTVFSLILLVVVFRVLNTEVRQRRMIEEEINLLNQQLEQRVRERTRELEVANSQIKSIYEHLEHRVVERTEQLEAANKELEAFSYSVSHDLRAPLRALDGFSRILLEDYADQLDEDARDYLQIVRDNATQMGHLVDDLLAFSRLSRQTLETEDVDMALLVQRLMHEVRREAGERRVEFIVGALPPCKGDPALLKQVWLNLLFNAVKYSRTREVAVIEVGSCDMRDMLSETIFAAQAAAHHEVSSTQNVATVEHVVYFVRDNGVGFDMEYAHKLFGVFQRLHRAEDYEGTGVGLAIVQRIINRHGGRVWAKAEVHKGATFYFSMQRGEVNVR